MAFFVAAAWAGGLAILAAQTPGAGDLTFHAATREVLVDAVVADRKGNFQWDLTQRDFKIFEDGKEQKIASFSIETAAMAGHSSPHYLALVFESEDPGLREQVIRFVDRYASPDLYMAVFSRMNSELRLRQAFTSDAPRIEAALRAMQIVPPRPGLSKDSPLLMFDRVGSVAQAMSPILGRKALILFSYGFGGSRPAAVLTEHGYIRNPPAAASFTHKAIDDCNAANVSVYSFINQEVRKNTGGAPDWYYERPQEPADDRGGSTDLIQDLALGTGGKYTARGEYDLAAYLGSVSKEQGDYYLLGYIPSAEAADKPCHKLKVKVDRGGLEVDARDSYCTSASGMPHGLKPAQKALEARAASGVPGNLAAGLQLSWFYTKPDLAVVDIALDIDPAGVKMKGKLHGEFDLLGMAYRPDGSVGARVPDTVKLDFDTAEQLSAFLKVPYHYSNQFAVAPGRYRFRIVAGSTDQAFGSVEEVLDIEPWSGQTLSVSGLALGVRDYPLTGVTAELSDSLLEGPRRFASKGRALVPMGGNQLPAGRNGMFYFEIYAPRQAGAPAFRVRILDRATSAVKADSGSMDAADWMEPGQSAIPIALTFPASKLLAGSYVLELRVTDEDGQNGVVRTADFSVK